MKKTLPLLLVLTVLAVDGLAQYNQIFPTAAPSGQTIYYRIRQESNGQTIAEISSPTTSWTGYAKPTGDLVIPDSVIHEGAAYPVKIVGNGAFWGCDSLTTVTLPRIVHTILSNAFGNCSRMTSIDVPYTVGTLGGGVFQGCSSLTSIAIPYLVLSVPGNCFRGCSSLTAVTFHNQVETIARNAFADCSALVSLQTPRSLRYIDDSAFARCTSLTSFYLLDLDPYQEGIKSIGKDVFCGCSSLALVHIGEGFQTIGRRAFKDCTGLWSLTLANSILYIDKNAFENCGIEGNLVLPESLRQLYEGCFRGCTRISSITCRIDTPPTLETGVFDSLDSDINVYVPCHTSETYASAWTCFHNYVEIFYRFTAQAYDSTQGTVRVLQEPTCDDPVAIVEAVPRRGFRLLQWNDGSTENPHTITVTGDRTLEAFFTPADDTTGIATADATALFPRVYAQDGRIMVEGNEGDEVRLYDIMGRLIGGLDPTRTYPKGFYLVRIGSHPVRKVVIQ